MRAGHPRRSPMTHDISNTHSSLEARLALPAAGLGRKRHVVPNPNLAACYSRFSTTGQKEVSIERQEEVCGEYAAANGMTVVASFADRARSGGYIVGRDALESMMTAARAGEFGTVLVENVDRVARDLGFLSTCFKTLQNLGISIHQPGRGKLTLTDIAFQGLMGDEGRRMMSERAQHARRVMAREGRVPTGHCLGYAKVPGRPGELVVDEREAAIVRRIFGMRLDGIGVRRICTILIREGVTFPRSGGLTQNGVAQILRNARYAGFSIYGRTVTVRDRESGRRTVSERPRSEWIETELPHLRIVDPDTWEKVQDVGRRRSSGQPSPRPARRSDNYMLSGLVKCSACGGNMTARSNRQGRRYVCSAYSREGNCVNGKSVDIRKLERLVLGLLADRLGAPAFVEAFVEAYNEEASLAERAHADRRADLERKVLHLTRDIDASFRETLTEGYSNATRARNRAAMEAELAGAEGELVAMPRRADAVRLDRGRVATLSGTLGGMIELAPYRPTDEQGLRVLRCIRDLVERVDVRGTGYRCFDVEVSLRVGRLCQSPAVEPVASATMVLAATMARPDKSYRASARASTDAERHARGDFDLTQGDWEAVEALVPDDAFASGRPGSKRLRAAVEASVFMAMTGSAWTGLPRGVGSPGYLLGITLDLRASGTWDRIARTLAERHPGRFADLPAKPFGPNGRKTRDALCRRVAAHRKRQAGA